MTTILSDEVNFLVYRYLQESGYQHSAFSFGLESHIAQSNINGTSVPPGALISILQKGIQFIEGELCINDDGTLVDNLEVLGNIPLIEAVIPEALADRAASIYRLLSEKADLTRKSKSQHYFENEKEEGNSGTVLLMGHKSEMLTPNSKAAYQKLPRYARRIFRKVFSSSWHPSSKMLATGSADGIVGIWNLNSVNKTEMIQLDHNLNNLKKSQGTDVTSLVWHPDGHFLASCSASEDNIYIWALDGKMITTLQGHTDLILSLNWNKKGDYLLSAGLDMKCIIWSTSAWRQVQIYNCHTGPVVDTDWLDNTTFASCSTDRTICICKIGQEEPVEILNGHVDAINCVEWDPPGHVLASCSDDRLIKLWNTSNSKSCRDLVGHAKEVTQLKWNNKNILASASYDASVRLWNTDKCLCLHVLAHHFEPVNSISFHPGSQYLMSGSQDGLINIWSIQEGACLYSNRGSAGIFELQWSPDGTYVCVCQADKVVKLIEFRKFIDS